jgi:fanconi-associated nuclease 1
MALQDQSPTKYNVMLGRYLQRDSTPAAIKEQKRSRSTKRLKRARDDDDDRSDESSDPVSKSPMPVEKIISDSDAGSEDEEAEAFESSQRTDLESALPSIKTDKEAIEEYEAQRAVENADLGVEGRMEKAEWVKGRSSIYVDAFNLALSTVLEEESHLFNAAELKVFEDWRALSYEAQYL